MSSESKSLPPPMQHFREAAMREVGELQRADASEVQAAAKALYLSSRTDGGRSLPPYYLVYFLLVDLLGFPDLGQSEKVAWTVPLRYRGRMYAVEHRKMGLGIFAPTLDPKAMTNAPPTEQAETDAREIAELIRRGVTAAEPYFEWRAEQAAAGSRLNVVNNSDWLFERYEFFRDQFKKVSAEAELRKKESKTEKRTLEDGTVISTTTFPAFALHRHADWNAQAAVEAFFSWTEHAFIHLAILQGRLRSGDHVARIAEADWKTKFKAALDLSDAETKQHYDNLLELRAQIRNFMAHGAFGKQGEAFRFHSGAGAVPVLLTGRHKHRFALSGEPAFDESWAISEIERFVDHLWSGLRLPAKQYLFSGLPSILTYVADGTYRRAMQSVEDMEEFVEYLTREFDDAANMDW